MRAVLATLAFAGCAASPEIVDDRQTGGDIRSSIVLAEATELSAMALMDHPLWNGSLSIDGAYHLKLNVRRVLAGPDPTGGDREIEIDTVAHALAFSGKSWVFLIRTTRSGEVVGFSPWSWPDKACFWPEHIEDTGLERFFTDKTDDKWCGASS